MRGIGLLEFDRIQIAQACADWRGMVCLVATVRRPSVSRPGLQALTTAACARVTAAGYRLPWNLAWQGSAVGLPGARPVHVSHEERDRYVGDYARMAGFLDAMAEGGAELSAWKRFCGRTLSPRGVGSPATSLDLWKAARVHQHPYRAQARLLKVRNRANEILRPYGLCVSNAAMAEVLSATWHGTGKAALRAANETCRRILDRAGAYERYDGRVDTSSWPDTQVWGQYQSRHWFYRAMPGVPRRMAALVAMQARHLPAEVRQTIEANRYLGHAEERFGIDLAIRGAAERATRLRTWQAEGLLPDMGHRRVLVWKNVRAEKEDGVWFGHEHYPYRIGEPCTAAAPMACAGPFGAWRDWTRNAGKCYILALSARITDIRSDGALTLADAMPVAAYRCTKVGEGEIRLDLIEGEDVLPLIQEGI